MKPIMLVGILLCVILIFGCKSETPKSKPITKVCIDKDCFNVELAVTSETMSRGLMYRTELPEENGMLFIFIHEAYHSFWMKNTLIPLDIIWIGANKEIVYISKNTMPCTTPICPSINPSVAAKYVLEINGGISDREGFEVGGAVEFK